MSATGVSNTAGLPAQTGGGATRTPTAGAASAAQSPGAFKIINLQNEARKRYLKALFYGGPGTGKSTLCGSSTNLAGMQDVLLLTAEGGDIVFEDNERVHNPGNMDIIEIKRIEMLQKVWEFLGHHIRARDKNDEATLRKLQSQVFGIPEDQIDRVRRYHTVIMDSMTDMEALNLNKTMGLDGKGFEVGDDFDAPDWGIFRKNNYVIQTIMRSFRNLDMNILVICGHRWMQDEQKKFHYTPWLTGQLATQVQSFVDLVGYMVISGANPEDPDLRRLYIQPQSGAAKFDAKCRRASVKEKWFDNPTMPTIMKAFGLAQPLPQPVATVVAPEVVEPIEPPPAEVKPIEETVPA